VSIYRENMAPTPGAAVMRWKIEAWEDGITSTGSASSHCPACGGDVLVLGTERPWICRGQRSLFRGRKLCPHTRAHFHWHCCRCQNRWLMAIKSDPSEGEAA
jgi:hypothetical protein